MPNSHDEPLRTPEESVEAIYRLAYTYALDALRDGTHPDAVRLTLLVADESDHGPRSRLTEAKWCGLEDALAGRPPSPPAIPGSQTRRTWRVDQRPGRR